MFPAHRFFAGLLLAITSISSAYAADYTPPSTTIPADATGIYQVDKNHASIIASVLHMGYSNYPMRFNQFDATLDFNATDIAKSKVDVTVHTGSVDSHNSELEGKLQDKPFFDIKQYPTASFTSTAITKTSATEGTLTGNLTLLGVTKPISLNVVFHGYGINPYSSAPTMGFTAIGNFKRSDFGMDAYVPLVSDEVDLVINAEFNKKK